MRLNFNELSLNELNLIKNQYIIYINSIDKEINKRKELLENESEKKINEKIGIIINDYNISIGKKFKSESIGDGFIVDVCFCKHKNEAVVKYKLHGHSKPQFAPFEKYKFNEIAKGLIK